MPESAAERFRRADAVFDAALDIGPELRAAFVERTCGSDEGLRADVDRLLRAHERVDDFLIEPLLESVSLQLGSEGPVPPPARMGVYRIERELGRGGMGVVYLAERDDETNTGPSPRTLVALKALRSGLLSAGSVARRFLAERQILASLDHPNVARLLDAGVAADDTPYFTMEYCPGGSLADRLAADGALALPEALDIARQLAAALGAAHAHGVVHRDVKPGNVLFDAEGRVRLSDFGIAKILDQDSTRSGAVLGTVSYLAPEQLYGRPADHRADLWALGVTLYEMLNGCRPFTGDTYAAVLHAVLATEPSPLDTRDATVSENLHALVARLLAKDPGDRPQSAREVEQALDALIRGDASVSLRVTSRAVEKVSTPVEVRVSGWRRPTMWAAAAVVVTGISVVADRWWLRDRDPEFVVVADFQTAPADSQIADWLTEGTRRALSASRSLGAAPDNRILAGRQRLHVPRNARVTDSVARLIALGVGIRSIVVPSLRSFSGGYAMSMSIVSASTGKALATARQAGIDRSQLFTAVDSLTQQLRKEAGDDLDAIRLQPPMLALTSTSLEAMTDYVTALRIARDSGVRTVALLREAVSLDTSFASALWQLAHLAYLDGPTPDADRHELLARAWNHRSGLTEYEQQRVELAYRYTPNGETPNVGQHLERLHQVVERYPNAEDAVTLADMYFVRRELGPAERAYRLAIALDSTRSEGYSGVVNVSLAANRIGDARRAAGELARVFPGSIQTDLIDATVSYAEGRPERTREIFRRMKTVAGRSQLAGYNGIAGLDLLDGRMADFERELNARDSVARTPPGRLGLREDRLAALYWVVDHPEERLRVFESALASSPSLRLDLDAAERYAQFGRPDSARAVLAARGTVRRTIYWAGTDTLPVSAWIDLAEGRPRDAARKFRASRNLSGGNAPSRISRDAETGLAFERGGQLDSAIATYEHYLKAVPVLDLDAYRLVWVLEHVAALYEKRGDRSKAKAAYTRVAAQWADADPELRERVRFAREHAGR